MFGEVSRAGDQWTNDDAELRDGIRVGLAFLLYTVGITAMMRDDGDPSASVPEWMVESSIRRTGGKDGFLVESVDIDAEASGVAVPELLDALESGEDISLAGLCHLIESGALDVDSVQDCLREQFEAVTDDEGV